MLFRPFPRPVVLHDERKQQFNKRLCRERRIVENVWYTNTKMENFLRFIENDVQTTEHVVKAAYYLHNFLKIKQGMTVVDDSENPHDITHGLTSARPTNRRSSTAAFEI